MPTPDYSKTVWVNDADPPVSAANLNKIETQLDLVTDGVISLESGSTLPSGVMMDFGGDSAPAGWLLCDGASLLRADYAALFAAIGTRFGAADGTHFNLPDFRGRVAVGKGTHADHDAVGDSDGLSVNARRTKHKHVAADHAHTYSGLTFVGGTSGFPTGGGYQITAGQATTGVSPSSSLTVGPNTGNEPTDGAAYLTVSKIIKT